jgi:solute carrier family 8 (sodium/calcium exchanger)
VALSLPEEAGLAAIAERKRPQDRTEEDKMALLGRPRLGGITRAQIRIKESKEFKVRISALFYFLSWRKVNTKI